MTSYCDIFTLRFKLLILLIFFSLFTFLVQPVYATSLQQIDDPVQLVEQGDILLFKSDFKGAEEAYNSAIKVAPKYAAAYAHRCYLRSFQLQSDNAIADCQLAITLEPRNAEGYIYLTRAYDWSGDFKKAVETGEKAIVLAPQSGLAHSFLGEAYVDIGQLQNGEHELKLGIKLSPKVAEVHRNLAFFYLESNQPKEQLTQMSEAIQLAPDFDAILWDLAYAYFLNANLDKATESYNKALLIERTIGDRSRQGNTLLYIGRMYAWIQEYDKAREYYQQALTIRDETQDYYNQGLILDYIVVSYDLQSQYSKALDYGLQELAVWRKIGERSREGNTLKYIGGLYLHQSEYTKALEYYEQALVIFQENNDLLNQGETLSNIGLTNQNIAKYDKAFEYYQKALSIFQKINDTRNEITVINNIGVVYRYQNQPAKALEYFQRSLDMIADNDLPLKLTVLNNIGDIYSSLSQYNTALDKFQQSLGIAREIGSKDDEATVLTNIAKTYYLQSEFAKALEYYEQALTTKQETGDQDGQAVALNGIGLIYQSQGYYNQALTYLQRSLAIAQAIGKRDSEELALNNIGRVYEAKNQYMMALEYYQRSLMIAQEIGNRHSEAVSLGNIGSIYSAVGSKQSNKVLEYYQQALTIFREFGEKNNEAKALEKIGSIYYSRGQKDKALEYFQQSLNNSQEVGDREQEAETFKNIGLVYISKEQSDKALEYFQKALIIQREIRDRNGEGSTLNDIGLIYQDKEQYPKALEYFQQSLSIARELGVHDLEGATLANISSMFYSQNKYSETLEYAQQAVAAFDTIRATGSTEQFRYDYISQYIFLYNRIVDASYKENELDEAFQFSEQGRARSFLDSMSTGYVELNDNEAAGFYEKEQEAYAVRQSAQEALNKAKAQNPPDEQLIADLTTQLAQAEKDYQSALDAISQRDAYLEQLIPGRSKVLDAPQAQALLDPQTTLLSFWTLDDQTLVFILTNDTFNTIVLPISRQDLYAKIKAFRDFPNINEAYPESAVELYKTLVGPLKPYLSKPNLVIVPQGELHYLPFAALTDGKRFLMDDYSITYLPSVSAWPYIKQNAERASDNPLIIGNPNSDHSELQPLPFAESEAQAIAGLYQTMPLLGKAATESALRSRVGEAGILHLAAHGSYNTVNPLYSAIYLTPDGQNDGLLEVHEIYGLDLKKTDLVVLSACDTQLGELSTGDELVGLTRAFFFAGTPSVISSLWSVDDQATQLLMEKFYTHWKNGMSKAEALRQAQMDVRAEYSNPYYWAGFVLSGDGGTPTQMTFSQNSTPINLFLILGAGCFCLVAVLIVVIAVGWVSGRRRKITHGY